MTNELQPLRVYMAAGGLVPQAFRWHGRTLRVLQVESLGLRGSERRYRLRTVQGPYELGVDTRSGAWAMRRQPGWLRRTWANIQRSPRYPLPASRRRGRLLRDGLAGPALRQQAAITAAPKRTTA
jgi:hypothetical protein